MNTLLYILWCVGTPLFIAGVVWWLLKVRDRLRLIWNAYRHERNLARWDKIVQEYYTVGQIYMPIGYISASCDIARTKPLNDGTMHHWLDEDWEPLTPENALLLLKVEVCEAIKNGYRASKWDPKTTLIRWEFFCDERKVRYQILTTESPQASWKKGKNLPHHLPFISPQDQASNADYLGWSEETGFSDFFRKAEFDDNIKRKLKYHVA